MSSASIDRPLCEPPAAVPAAQELAQRTRGAIDDETLESESRQTGLSKEIIAEGNQHIVYAAAGRDSSAYAARSLLRFAMADIDIARQARYDDSIDRENPAFRDYTSDEGKERRKVWKEFSTSARQNLAEVRKFFIHATIFTQHIGAEESSRATKVDPQTGHVIREDATDGQVHGVASRFAHLVDADGPTVREQRRAKRALDALGKELLQAEATLAETV